MKICGQIFFEMLDSIFGPYCGHLRYMDSDFNKKLLCKIKNHLFDDTRDRTGQIIRYTGTNVVIKY